MVRKYKTIADIKFGELNDSLLQSELDMSQESLSRRRTSTTHTLRATAQEMYTQNSAEGTDRAPHAIILRCTEQKRPLMTNSVQLLKANFNSTSASDEVIITEVPKYYTYKVWVGEGPCAGLLPPESLSAVKGAHQGIINMAPDAFAAVGSDLEGIKLPEGLVCEYRYGNKYTLSPIVLTQPADIQFQLPGVKLDDTWKNQMKQRLQLAPPVVPGPSVPTGGTIDFFNKLKDSGVFTGWSNEILCGLVANAKSESNFRNNAVGDKISDISTRDVTKAIYTTPKHKTRWTGTGGADYYCSFGYWQLNVCSERGGGGQFAKKHGLWPVKDNQQALLTAIHNPMNQFKFLRDQMIKIFGALAVITPGLSTTEPNVKHSAEWWGQQIAIKFEKCIHCLAPGETRMTKSGKQMTSRGTVKRGAVARDLYGVVMKGGIPGKPIPPVTESNGGSTGS